jgi:hypothetical protein
VFPLGEIVGRCTLIVPSLFILCLLARHRDHGHSGNQKTAGWDIVSFIYINVVVHQLSIGATKFILASEAATTRLREATQALVPVANVEWGLIMQFIIPYIINSDAGDLGEKMGLIFLGPRLIAAMVTFPFS